MSRHISLRNTAIQRIERTRKYVAEKTGKDMDDITPSDIILYFVREPKQ